MNKNFRLKQTHPTMERLKKLFRYAEELGIALEFEGSVNTFVTDDKFPGEHPSNLQLKEMNSDNNIKTIPPICEYKLTYSKEEK